MFKTKNSIKDPGKDFHPNYLWTGKTEWAEICFRTFMAKKHVSRIYNCQKSGR